MYNLKREGRGKVSVGFPTPTKSNLCLLGYWLFAVSSYDPVGMGRAWKPHENIWIMCIKDCVHCRGNDIVCLFDHFITKKDTLWSGIVGINISLKKYILITDWYKACLKRKHRICLQMMLRHHKLSRDLRQTLAVHHQTGRSLLRPEGL